MAREVVGQQIKLRTVALSYAESCTNKPMGWTECYIETSSILGDRTLKLFVKRLIIMKLTRIWPVGTKFVLLM